MKITLADNTYAHLWGIVQSCDYRRDYLKLPPNAGEEIKRIAQTFQPLTWRSAPLVLLAAENNALNELMRRKKLPPVMCLGEFVSYRKHDDERTNPLFLHVIWLQEDFAPHMSPENEALFRLIKWDNFQC